MKPAENLPVREETLKYLERMRQKVNIWLDAYKDRPEEVHDRETGVNPFPAVDLALYTLRHLQLCQGQISAEIRRRNIEWKHWCW